MDEFIGLAGNDFDMLNFVKKLPPEVVKVKAQLKVPFGKPADSKKTDIGITVGCLNAFPEAPDEIMLVLKDVSIEMAKGIVASEAGIAKSEIPNDISELKDLALESGANSVADALDFLAGSSSEAAPKATMAAATAEDGEKEKPEEKSSEKIDIRFGVRMGYSINNFSFGNKKMDALLGAGQSLWAGLTLNVPITSIIMLNAGVDFYYRELFKGPVHWNFYVGGEEYIFEDMDESVISIPVLLQFGNSFYFTAGLQLDIPFDVETYYETKTEFDTDKENFLADKLIKDRSPVDFGLGYRFANFVFDFKYVRVLTDLFKDYDKSSLGQYSFGVSHFF
jgi:hypothetical protein